MLIVASFTSFVFFLISIKRWNKFFDFSGISPSVLYSLLWGCIYIIQLINPFNYRDISDLAILLSLIPLFAVFFGENLAYPKKKYKLNFTYKVPNEKLKKVLLYLSIFLFILSILLFIATVLTFGKFWLSGGGVELKKARSLLGSAAYSGSKYGVIARYYEIIRGTIKVVFVLGLFYNYFAKKKSLLILILPLATIVLMGISWGARSGIASTMIYYLIFIMITRRDKFINFFNFKNVFIFSGVIFLFFIITLSTRKENLVEVNGKYYPRTIIQIIDYAAGPIITFSDEIKNAETTYGRLSFGGIESFFRMAKLVSAPTPKVYFKLQNNSIPISKDFNYHRTLNTYSWLLYLFYDFNVFGLFIIPFFISFIITRQFFKFRYYEGGKLFRGTLLILLLSILVSSNTIFSFADFSYVFSLFVLFFLSTLSRFVGFYYRA